MTLRPSTQEAADEILDRFLNPALSSSSQQNLAAVAVNLSRALNGAGGDVREISSAWQLDRIDLERPNQTYVLTDKIFVRRTSSFDIMGANTKIIGAPFGGHLTIAHSVQLTDKLTNDGGNQWSVAFPAFDPTNAFVRVSADASSFDPRTIAKLTKNTSTPTSLNAGEWGYSAGRFRVYAERDPNGFTIELVAASIDNGGNGIRVMAPNCEIGDFSTYFTKWSGLTAQGVESSGLIARRFRVIGSCQDGFGTGSGATVPTTATFKNFMAWYNGNGPKDGGGSDGDGGSGHDQTDMTAGPWLLQEDGDIRYNTKSGIGHQSGVDSIVRRCYFEDNYQSIAVFPVAFTGGAITQRFEYCTVVRRTGEDASVYVSPSPADIAHPFRLELVNNTFWSETADSSKPAIRVPNSASTTIYMRNCIIKGYARGVQDSFNVATLDFDYNCVSGNTTNFWDNSTGNLAPKAGSHTITSDPLFNSAATGDFSLQTGSPCKNAGVNLGLTLDYRLGPVPFGATPDMGAWERQSA